MTHSPTQSLARNIYQTNRVHLKIGGKSLAIPEDVLNLAKQELDQGRLPSFTVSAPGETTNMLDQSITKLHGNKNITKEDIRFSFSTINEYLTSLLDQNNFPKERKESFFNRIFGRLYDIQKRILQHNGNDFSPGFSPEINELRDFILGSGELFGQIYLEEYLIGNGFDQNQVIVVDNIKYSSNNENKELNKDKIIEEVINTTKERVNEILSDSNNRNKILVFGGQRDGIPGGMIESLGRSYTDLIALIDALALGAKELYLCKNTNLLSADPRIIDNPIPINATSINELINIPSGDLSIHPNVAKLLHAYRDKELKMFFKNIDSDTKDAVTEIVDGEILSEQPFKRIIKTKIEYLSVSCPGMKGTDGFLEEIAIVLEKYRLSVEERPSGATSAGYTFNVPSDDLAQKKFYNNLNKAKNDLAKISVNGFSYQADVKLVNEKNLAGIYLNGDEMIDNIIFRAEFMTFLANNKENIPTIGQAQLLEGGNSIAIFVPSDKANSVMQLIHNKFISIDQARLISA